MNNNIYIFGGLCEFSKTETVFKLDTFTDEWITLAHMPFPACNHSAQLLGDLVYILGIGSRGEVLQFTPASGIFKFVAPTLENRTGCVSFVLDN